MVSVIRLNRPNLKVRLPGSFISNRRYTAIAVTQKTGLINKVNLNYPIAIGFSRVKNY